MDIGRGDGVFGPPVSLITLSRRTPHRLLHDTGVTADPGSGRARCQGSPVGGCIITRVRTDTPGRMLARSVHSSRGLVLRRPREAS